MIINGSDAASISSSGVNYDGGGSNSFSLPSPAAAGQGCRPSDRSGSLRTVFGPSAPEVEVTPRLACNSSSIGEQGGSPSEALKPYTGMTIRLTPELLTRFRVPGPKPEIELVLNGASAGGPVLVVGGVPHNMNAHQMAVGSEVHIVAKTNPSDGADSAGSRQGSRVAVAREDRMAGKAGMSVLASLHRKLIVQQVLTEAKRAEIRARKDEIDRREKQAKKKMVRMEDQEEMLAAAESIPVPLGQTPQQESKEHRVGGRGLTAIEAAAGPEEIAGGGDEWRRGRRRKDPLMAWVSNCYNSDEYTGHVSDLRNFLKGIDFHHVLFRYHVKPDGTLDVDRRRFCIKFKTKAGRDLAIKRSGEALGSYCSWWNPDNVVVVLKGRDEDDNGRDGGGGGGCGESISDLLLVLPHGRSVADVLEKVKMRLPRDLAPALSGGMCRAEETEEADVHRRNRKKRKHRDRDRDQDHYQHNDDDHTRNHYSSSSISSSSASRQRQPKLEAFRRDMLRAALGAGLAEASALGPKRGAPAAAVRAAGTDENNARRVATLASREAAKDLDFVSNSGAAAFGAGLGKSLHNTTMATASRNRYAGEKASKRRKGDDERRGGGGRRLTLVSGPAGGARAQRRRRLLHAEEEGRRR